MDAHGQEVCNAQPLKDTAHRLGRCSCKHQVCLVPSTTRWRGYLPAIPPISLKTNKNKVWSGEADCPHLSPVATDRIFASGLKARAVTGPWCSFALKTTVKPAAAVSTSLTTPASDPRATKLLCMLLARHLLLTETAAVADKHGTCSR